MNSLMVSFNRLSPKPVIWFWILFLSQSITVSAQSKVFQSIKENYALEAELYFYASTLRMINIGKNPDFNEMVKDIEKMSFYKIKTLPKSEFRSLVTSFKKEEQFEELMTIDSKEETIHILGRGEKEFVAMVNAGADIVAVNLKGSIGIHKIPELINSLNTDNFLNVFEIGRDERIEHQKDVRNN